VKPEGAAFDDIGRGEMEGVSNVQAPSEVAASKSLEVLKQISSTTDTAVVADVAVAETSTVAVATSMNARDKAKMQGYEGEACGECGNYTLVRNGTCMKCNTCGGTSGCS